MSTVQEAAISYFGLPEGTTLVEGGPVGAFAFIIPLTEEHLRGIADRMKAMAETAAPAAVFVASPSRDELRAEWDKLSQADRGRFGSFGRYAAQSAMGLAADDAIEPTEGVGGREVKHVDAPVEAAPSALPDAVWVPLDDVSDQQRLMASDWQNTSDNVEYLIQVAMLTDEQRAKYAAGGA